MLRLVITLTCVARIASAEDAATQATKDELARLGYPGAITEDEFLRAAQDGNTKALVLFLGAGIAVNAKSSFLDQNTALMLAALNGNAGAVKLLLKKGAFIDAKNKSSQNALMLAAKKGHAETVEVLVKNGAKVNETDNAGKTPLIHAAAGAGDSQTMKALLANKADPNIKDNAGNTALDYARKKGDTTLVNLLQSPSLWAEIEGAFGLELGGTFDVVKAARVDPAQWDEQGEGVGEHQLVLVYKFTPQNPLPPFESYYVEITPKTHKICAIYAVRENQSQESDAQLDVVKAALSYKYGSSDRSGWGFVLYSTFRNGRGVGLLRTDPRGGLDNKSQQARMNVVTLSYADSSLENLAKRERAEIMKAEQDSKQRELEKKAKALEKSGI